MTSYPDFDPLHAPEFPPQKDLPEPRNNFSENDLDAPLDEDLDAPLDEDLDAPLDEDLDAPLKLEGMLFSEFLSPGDLDGSNWDRDARLPDLPSTVWDEPPLPQEAVLRAMAEARRFAAPAAAYEPPSGALPALQQRSSFTPRMQVQVQPSPPPLAEPLAEPVAEPLAEPVSGAQADPIVDRFSEPPGTPARGLRLDPAAGIYGNLADTSWLAAGQTTEADAPTQAAPEQQLADRGGPEPGAAVPVDAETGPAEGRAAEAEQLTEQPAAPVSASLSNEKTLAVVEAPIARLDPEAAQPPAGEAAAATTAWPAGRRARLRVVEAHAHEVELAAQKEPEESRLKEIEPEEVVPGAAGAEALDLQPVAAALDADAIAAVEESTGEPVAAVEAPAEPVQGEPPLQSSPVSPPEPLTLAAFALPALPTLVRLEEGLVEIVGFQETGKTHRPPSLTNVPTSGLKHGLKTGLTPEPAPGLSLAAEASAAMVLAPPAALVAHRPLFQAFYPSSAGLELQKPATPAPEIAGQEIAGPEITGQEIASDEAAGKRPLFHSFYAATALREERSKAGKRTPHLGHLLLLLVLAGLGVSGSGLLIRSAVSAHLWGVTRMQDAMTDVRYTIGSMAALYLITFSVALIVYPLLWGRSLFSGLQWNATAAGRRIGTLLGAAGLCFVLALADQVLLPGPTDAPIDKLFDSRTAAWLLLVFGITFAPFFEEIVFRGFLLPALCTAFDWYGEKLSGDAPRALGGDLHPNWSMPAMVLGAIFTSIPFAYMHAEQTGYSLGPFLLLVAVSLVLCWARLSTRSLAASMVVHASYNLLLFSLMLVGTRGFTQLEKM